MGSSCSKRMRAGHRSRRGARGRGQVDISEGARGGRSAVRLARAGHREIAAWQDAPFARAWSPSAGGRAPSSGCSSRRECAAAASSRCPTFGVGRTKGGQAGQARSGRWAGAARRPEGGRRHGRLQGVDADLAGVGEGCEGGTTSRTVQRLVQGGRAGRRASHAPPPRRKVARAEGGGGSGRPDGRESADAPMTRTAGRAISHGKGMLRGCVWGVGLVLSRGPRKQAARMMARGRPSGGSSWLLLGRTRGRAAPSHPTSTCQPTQTAPSFDDGRPHSQPGPQI